MSAEVRQLALFAAPDRYGTTDMFVTPGTDAPDAEAARAEWHAWYDSADPNGSIESDGQL
jgi:hypothetical protein